MGRGLIDEIMEKNVTAQLVVDWEWAGEGEVGGALY